MEFLLRSTINGDYRKGELILKNQLNEVRRLAQEELDRIEDLKELEEFRVKLLGKKGKLTQILRGMGQLSPEERPVIGKIANQIRSEVEGKIEETKANIQKKERDLRLLEEKIDVTLPGKKHRLGIDIPSPCFR